MSSTTEKRKPGRPRLAIDPQAVVDLRRAPERWTWEQIAGKLGISSKSAERLFRTYQQDQVIANTPAV